MKKSILTTLVSIALAAVILFAASNGLAALRAENTRKELEDVMRSILPGSSTFTEEPYTGDDANIRTAYKSETGYVIHTVTSGYVGPISMLVAVKTDGHVAGLVVRDLQETPGLGARALTDTDFLAQFLDSTGSAAVGTNIDAITGATVTSKAVTRGVNSAVSYVTDADTSSGATAWGG